MRLGVLLIIMAMLLNILPYYILADVTCMSFLSKRTSKSRCYKFKCSLAIKSHMMGMLPSIKQLLLSKILHCICSMVINGILNNVT